MNSLTRWIFFAILVGAIVYGANKYGLFGDASVPLATPQKWGFIDHTGQMVIAPKFDAVAGCTILDGGTQGLRPTQCFHEGLAAVAVGKEWGFIDKAGKLIVPARYSFVGNFSDGLATFTIDGDSHYGFLDKAGREVIPPKFVAAQDFHNGLAAVAIEHHKFGYVDKSGKFAIEPQFDVADVFSDGLAWVRTATSSYYVDSTGKKVIDVPVENIPLRFSEGRACILGPQGDSGYVIDKTGAVIFRFAGRSEGVKNGIVLCLGTQPGTIYDASGKKLAVLDSKISIQNPFSEGLCSAAMEEVTEPLTGAGWIKAGYIDSTGQWKIRPAFYGPAQDFHDGLAAVTEWKAGPGGRRPFGFIDKSGKFTLSPRYTYAFPFSEGLAAVQVPVGK